MKKAICILFGFVLIAFSVSGCTWKSAYAVPDGRCIVSVPQDFCMSSPINSETECEKIETAIRGVKKLEGRDYYSVTKNAPLEILKQNSWFDYDENNFGKGKVLSGYRIGEETVKFRLYDIDFDFSCSGNCDIEPIYENFTTVGQIYFADPNVDAWDTLSLYDAKYFLNDDGNAKAVDNLYYLFVKSEFVDKLYLKDDYTVSKDFWNTNLTVRTYECDRRTDGSFTASFTADRVADRIASCSVCQYESGGYFISSVTIGAVGVTMDIGDSEMSLLFE